MTKTDKPVTRETTVTDGQGNPIIVTIGSETLGLRVKGKPREVFVVEYKKLLASLKCNIL